MWISDVLQLSMPVGAPLDVVVSNVISVNHLFLHLPSHPTFSKLEVLTSNMKKCYNLDCCVPDLPRPIEGIKTVPYYALRYYSHAPGVTSLYPLLL